jgi:fido (protein-threonine AMPylation protein)
MAHPCPESWEYKDHPRCRKLLPKRAADILVRLRTRKIDGERTAKDTRPIHRELFSELTPPHFTYYAGRYRGEPFPCLQECEVGIPGDARVGAPPDEVQERLEKLAELIGRVIAASDEAWKSTSLSDEDKVLHVTDAACAIFDLFLQVHPFANGNGHIARFMIWALMGRHGLWPVRWTLEPRPPDPPYIPLLQLHRAGNRRPLVEYVIKCIA